MLRATQLMRVLKDRVLAAKYWLSLERLRDSRTLPLADFGKLSLNVICPPAVRPTLTHFLGPFRMIRATSNPSGTGAPLVR